MSYSKLNAQGAPGLSVTNGDKEGKSKHEVANPYLRQSFKGFGDQKGWEMDSNIECLGID